MKWTLIYVDDQIQNIESFKLFLSENFNVIGCHDVNAFDNILKNHQPHAFLLDVHMPVMDGHELYRKIISHPSYNGCPVLFISGDSSDEVKIKSFNEGGVDFLPRTLSPKEIEIRLTNKVKFYLQVATNFEHGNLHLDLKTMKASINGVTLDLTMLELRMLGHLLRSFPESLSRAELIQRVWGNDSVKPGTINTHLTNLKPKIESWDHMIKVREDNILLLKKNGLNY